MFKLQRSRDIEEFTVALVRDFSSRFPPGTASGDRARLARAIDETCNRAKAFRLEKRLGIYGRAKMGTSFKFGLKNAGYPDDFVDDFTRQLLLIISGK
jgi:hypothetical protein